jgi:hypothetical protein
MTESHLVPRTRRRFAALATIMVLVVTSVLAAFSSPASAAGTSCYRDSPTNPWWSVCVVVSSGGTVSGYARWYYSDGYFNPANVWVQICRADRTACSTLTSRVQSGSNIVSTPTRTTVRAHTYRACTTFSVYLQGRQYWNWATARCSPFQAT